jgi:hypothetical protein
MSPTETLSLIDTTSILFKNPVKRLTRRRGEERFLIFHLRLWHIWAKADASDQEDGVIIKHLQVACLDARACRKMLRESYSGDGFTQPMKQGSKGLRLIHLFIRRQQEPGHQY